MAILILKIIAIVIIAIVIFLFLVVNMLKLLVGAVCQNVIETLNEKPLFNIFGWKVVSLNTDDIRKKHPTKINKIKSGDKEIWTIDLP